jgi:hypothetical protein
MDLNPPPSPILIQIPFLTLNYSGGAQKEPELIFPEPLQRQLLSLLLHEPEVLRQYAHVLKPEFWTNEVDATFAQIMIDFARGLPEDRLAKTVIFNGIRTLVDKKRIKKEVFPYFLKAFDEIGAVPSAPEYLKENLLRFM